MIDVVYSLLNPPSFVSLVTVGSSIWVEIQTSAYSDTGIYEIEVVTTDNESGLMKTQKF